MPHEPAYPHERVEIADRDFARAKRRATEEDWEDSGFRMQQAVEKFLKGYLAQRKLVFRYTHDLEELLEIAIEDDASWEEFREACQRISTFYMWDRYPRIMEEPLTETDIRDALEWAGKIRDRVKGATNA